jgi:hypothetical protein
MGKVSQLLIEAEEQLDDLLNTQGTTNKIALEIIQKELGTLAREHAEEILAKWKEEDYGDRYL